MDSGLLLEEITQTLLACSDPWEPGTQLAKSARENRTEAATFDRLHRGAVAAVQTQADRLTARPQPGTLADTQVLARLMSTNSFFSRVISTAERAFASYNSTHNPLDLDSAFLNTLRPTLGTAPLTAFVEAYPWSTGVCQAPDTLALATRLRTEVGWILNESKRLEPPSPDLPISEIYGSTLKTTLPNLQHYTQHAWWPALLRLSRAVSLDRAMLETYANNRLPTREEARFLVAEYQHNHRSWDTESIVADLGSRINDRADWEDHVPEAREALALAKMEAAFTGLRCAMSAQNR
jgi:hypothetical protein